MECSLHQLAKVEADRGPWAPMFKTLEWCMMLCIIRTVTEVCNTAWEPRGWGPSESWKLGSEVIEPVRKECEAKQLVVAHAPRPLAGIKNLDVKQILDSVFFTNSCQNLFFNFGSYHQAESNRIWFLCSNEPSLKSAKFELVPIVNCQNFHSKRIMGWSGLAFFFHPSGSTGLDPRSHPAWMWKKQASWWCSWGNEATRRSNIVCEDYTKMAGAKGKRPE